MPHSRATRLLTAAFLTMSVAGPVSAGESQAWDAIGASTNQRMAWREAEPASSVAVPGATFTELALTNKPAGRSVSAAGTRSELAPTDVASEFPLLWLATFSGMAAAVVVLRRHTQAKWKLPDQRRTLAPWGPAATPACSDAQGWRLSRFEELDEDDSLAPLYSSLDDPEDRNAAHPAEPHRLTRAHLPQQAPQKHAPHLIDLEIFDIEARLIRPHPPAGG